MTTCAIYIRKSREDKDRQAHRLTIQRQQLPAHALAQGWAVELYDDGFASAARGKTADLTQRARLQADISAGKVDIILCLELSRLSRDDSLQDYVAWLHLCGQHRVKLATPSRILNPAENSDWMLLLMEGGFSSVEMRTLTARMTEGREQARAVGKWLGGVVPWPYRYDREQRRPVLDPEQVDIFQTAMQLAESKSCTHITRALGLPSVRINRAVQDDRLLYYQAQRQIDGQIVPCEWQPILTSEQAGQIRANRQHHADRYPHGARQRPGGLLTGMGLIYCGHCGAAIQSGHHRNQYRRGYYYCSANQRRTACPASRRILQSNVDPLVINHVLSLPDQLADLQNYWLQSQTKTAPGNKLQAFEKEIFIARQKLNRIIDAIADGVISSDDARAKRQQLDTSIRTLQQSIDTLRQTMTPPAWDALTLTSDDWPHLNNEEQRKYLRTALEKIILHHDYIEIIHPYPINPAGNRVTIALPKKGINLKP